MMKQKIDKQFFLDTFTKKVCIEILQNIKTLFQKEVPLCEIAEHLSSPPNGKLGHWSLPCFFLSQIVKKKPEEIAKEFAKTFHGSSLVFEKVLPHGPYVNFFFRSSFLFSELLIPLESGAYFQIPAKKQNPYLIEYSQPNTHKELHVGHMRNLCFGLSLITLLRKRGFSVTTCTFPGDLGTHVAKCLWYLHYHNKESLPSVRKGQWLGQIYEKSHKKFEEEKNDPAENEKNQKQLTEILKNLQKKSGEFYSLWKKTRLWSQELMEEVYDWTGAKFDRWYWESELDEPSVKWVKELYQKGELQISKSAIGLDLGDSLGFCLLLKSDGNGLYSTKDLYLAKKKFEDYQPEKSIYIVDQRQERHFQQILKVLDRIGLKKVSHCSQHLKYNFVELKSGAMSSRSGNIVPIMKLIEQMTSYIEDIFLKKYKEEWSKEKSKKTAHIIAQGAIKYGMNEQDLNKKIIFDMKEWLKLDGRSGSYIQYAHARACSLLKKLNPPKKEQLKINPQEILIQTDEEWDLIIHLSWFSLVMEKSAWRMKTSSICYYLFDLAKKFSQFYQNCPIGTLKDEKQKTFRLFLVQIVQIVLAEGLSTLSIPAPEQM